MESKKCTKCGELKELSEFYCSSGNNYNKSSYCKVCARAASKERWKSKPEKLTHCKLCGNKIEGYGRQFCSMTCKSLYQHDSPRIVVTCMHCGLAFEKKASWAARSNLNFCSYNCYHQHLAENNWTTITCETCGVVKEVPLHRKDSRFCSKVCDSLWRRTLTGDKSTAWNGGASTENELARTTAAIKEWKLQVFQRDDWSCRCCGVRGVKLNAHHIKRFRDYPSLRTELSNGITLCVSCHKVETKKQLMEDKIWVKAAEANRKNKEPADGRIQD